MPKDRISIKKLARIRLNFTLDFSKLGNILQFKNNS